VATLFLTNESDAFRSVLPHLEANTAQVRGNFGPAAVISVRDKRRLTAAETVIEWALQPERTRFEKDMAARYLQQWEDGPQLTA
jgi:hypothetical protein